MRKNKKILNHWFRDALDYIGESKKYIYFCILLFIISGIIGFVFASSFGFIDELLKGLVDRTEGMGPIQLIGFILRNNFQASVIAIALGLFLGIFPVAASLYNGVIIGYVLRRSADVAGVLSFWRLLPHGVFELPAIFISFGLGIKLGMFVASISPWKELKKRAYNSLKVLVLIVLPLLIIAAVIEGTLIALTR